MQLEKVERVNAPIVCVAGSTPLRGLCKMHRVNIPRVKPATTTVIGGNWQYASFYQRIVIERKNGRLLGMPPTCKIKKPARATLLRTSKIASIRWLFGGRWRP
jgi:hypothetical protein